MRSKKAAPHHLYQRLPLWQYFPNLHGGHAGIGKRGEQDGGIGAGNGEQQSAGGPGTSARSLI
jgi:hypothetical protein